MSSGKPFSWLQTGCVHYLLMLPFAVFFADEAAVGVTRVDAPDAATAEPMVLDQHPGCRVHAVDGALVRGKTGYGCWRLGCGRGEPFVRVLSAAFSTNP